MLYFKKAYVEIKKLENKTGKNTNGDRIMSFLYQNLSFIEFK